MSADLFQSLTRTAYLYNGCLPWCNVVLTSRVHSSVKYSQASTVTAAVSCDGGISVLNHCLSWSKFVNTHLYHSRHWFNIHITLSREYDSIGRQRLWIGRAVPVTSLLRKTTTIKEHYRIATTTTKTLLLFELADGTRKNWGTWANQAVTPLLLNRCRRLARWLLLHSPIIIIIIIITVFSSVLANRLSMLF